MIVDKRTYYIRIHKCDWPGVQVNIIMYYVPRYVIYKMYNVYCYNLIINLYKAWER